MKQKTSMKICKEFKNVLCAGYCDLQCIFNGVEPNYYNCGVYGWNCDLYIDYATDTIITTGYRNMRGRSIDRDIITKYETIAKNIINDRNYFTDYEKMKKALENNRVAFLNEVLNR